MTASSVFLNETSQFAGASLTCPSCFQNYLTGGTGVYPSEIKIWKNRLFRFHGEGSALNVSS